MRHRHVVGSEPAGGWAPHLKQVLERMYAEFGPRFWWPAVGVPEPERAAPFEMIVGAILVQNVAWSNVEKALLALREAGLLEPAALHRAEPEVIEPLIRPTGYFRQKTKKLKAFCEYLFRQYSGDLAKLLARPLPALREELGALPGIGPETRDCILNYAAGYPVMAMDTYTRRIFSRMGIFDPAVSYETMSEFFHAHLPADTELLGEYHAQIDTLGHRLCLKTRPQCQKCPLQELCSRAGVEVNP